MQGSAASFILSRLPDESWQSCIVDFNTIHFCRRPDGSYVELGTGAFSTVYRVLLDGVQPHAAKVLHLGDDPKAQECFLQVWRRLACVHAVCRLCAHALRAPLGEPLLPSGYLGWLALAGLVSGVMRSLDALVPGWFPLTLAFNPLVVLCSPRASHNAVSVLVTHQEANILRQLRHRNIVAFNGVSVWEGRGVILMVSCAVLRNNACHAEPAAS